MVRKIAKEDNYIVETANQTTYPDFTLTNPKTEHRIAIDIKTTYASNRMVLTLGGYNSFLRNNTKNILHPYAHDHRVEGLYVQLVSVALSRWERLLAEEAVDTAMTAPP